MNETHKYRYKDGYIIDRFNDIMDSVDDYVDEMQSLSDENNELRELVDLITIQEESDSGRIFYPNSISSCRVLDSKRMGEITEKYRSKKHIERED